MASGPRPVRFLSASGRLRRDERGATLALTAVSITVLLAITGLAVDVGWWYTLQRQNQSAADAGALSAAYMVLNGNTDVVNELTPAASQGANLNGYSGSTPAVTYPYGGASQVEVRLSQVQPTWFASLTGLASVTLPTRAVALVENLEAACVLATNPTADDAIEIAGNAVVDIPDCTIVSNSDSASAFHLQGDAVVNAATLITPGGVDYTGGAYDLNVAYPAQTGGAATDDPYDCVSSPPSSDICLRHANLVYGMPTTPCVPPSSGTTWPGNCFIDNTSNAIKSDPSHTLSANTQIRGGLRVKNGTVNLSPGVYWITDGDLDLQSGTGAILGCPACSNGGDGVTIILTVSTTNKTVGAVTLASNANLTLNAPSTNSGVTGFNNAGMLLIQDSHDLPAGSTINSPSSAQANATEVLSGLLYFPNSHLDFQGTPFASGPQCLLVVANTVELRGNPELATSGCQCAPGAVSGTCLGLNTLPLPKKVVLVQ